MPNFSEKTQKERFDYAVSLVQRYKRLSDRELNRKMKLKYRWGLHHTTIAEVRKEASNDPSTFPAFRAPKSTPIVSQWKEGTVVQKVLTDTSSVEEELKTAALMLTDLMKKASIKGLHISETDGKYELSIQIYKVERKNFSLNSPEEMVDQNDDAADSAEASN